MDTIEYAPKKKSLLGGDLEPIISNDANSIEADLEEARRVAREAQPKVSKKAVFTLLIIVYINLLNYMDRFTVSSVLSDIKTWFSISDKQAGLLQTVFVCAYMVFAPIFGYLGDRFSRKYVMAVGITIWTITTFCGSLMGRDHFYGFLALRGLVGVGEASYSTVAPTIIADLFVKDRRTKALTLFYFAIPCGSGLGYIVGSEVSALMKTADNSGWQWALRVTPALGIVGVILTLIGIREPQRGAIETSSDELDESEAPLVVNTNGYFDDLREILKVKSFLWASFGFTCVSFVVGALSWWAPSFALYAEQVHDKSSKRTIDEVSYIFGIVTFVAGVVGVGVGAEWARRWRITNMKADALVCGIGIMLSTPFLFFALWSADKHIILSWVLICVGEVCMFFNWAPNGDILLYVIPPNCRGTAEALQILMIHIFGDAFSPFVVGAISDAYVGHHKSDIKYKHHGLLYSLYMTPFICVFGALCYFVTAQYLQGDKANCDAIIANGGTVNRNVYSDSHPSSSNSQVLVFPVDASDSGIVNGSYDDFHEGRGGSRGAGGRSEAIPV